MADPRVKPLAKAVENTGPLPGWLFSHPVIAGFFAMIMCPVFGGVSFMFWFSVGGQLVAVEYYSVFVSGGILGILIGAIVLLLIFASAFIDRDEAKYRMLFCLGGALGIAVFFVGLFLFSSRVEQVLTS